MIERKRSLLDVDRSSIQLARDLGDQRSSLMRRSRCVAHDASARRQIHHGGLVRIHLDDFFSSLQFHGCRGIVRDGDLDRLRLVEHRMNRRMHAGGGIDGGRGRQRSGDDKSSDNKIAIVHKYLPVCYCVHSDGALCHGSEAPS